MIKLLINGVDCTDRIWYGSSCSWNLSRGSRGTCTIPLIVDPSEVFFAEVGERIEIFDPDTARVWIGTVEAQAVRWLGDDGWHVITVSGVSYEELFDTVDLEKVKFVGVTCGAALSALHSLSGVTAVGLGTVSDGPLVESLEVSNVSQGFAALALLAGFVWYVDPADSSLYFHAPGARAAAWTVASGNIRWETIDWKQGREDFRSTQRTQLPGVSMAPVIATFNGNGTATAFTLPSIPQYIISIAMSIGSFARTSAWAPGTDQVTVTPALPTGSTLTVRYSDGGLVDVTAPNPGIGPRTARYSNTRSFTPAGGLQEATAILARYAMLPGQLQFSTDKPGIQIARKLTIAIDEPLGASNYLNGEWLVKEVEGALVPGLELRAEPFGHFRYTVHLINTAATAIFQGDGVTTDFELPIIPSSVPSTRIAGGSVGTWTGATRFMSIVPALAAGESAAVDYVDASNAPDVPTWINTWDDMASGGGGAGGGEGTGGPVVLSGDPPGNVAGEETSQQVFIRTLTLYNLAVGDDIAPHTLVYNDGTAYRLIAVMRKDMTADLTVRFNKGIQFALEELITVTIPLTSVIDDVFEWPLVVGSPAILATFFDQEILTADITASDGSTDVNGIVQFTIQWTKNPLPLV